MLLLKKISQLFSKKKSSQRIGLACQQEAISLCSIPTKNSAADGNADKTAKVLFHQEKVNSLKFPQAIDSLHTHCELEGELTIVLNESQSQIVQVDKPNVPENEINSALKWQIKDLVSITPENMILDYYDAPNLTGGKDKINVVCAPLNELKNIVTAAEVNKVKINAITTQEFAFANLLPPQNDAYLLVCQQPNEEIVLLIVKQQQIFFHRRLRGYSLIGNKTAEELLQTVIDDISLEIQRSTDYFERQLKQAPIKEIKVLLPIDLEGVFIEKLNDYTSAPVTQLTLPRPYHEHREYAAAIGATIRAEDYQSESADEVEATV